MCPGDGLLHPGPGPGGGRGRGGGAARAQRRLHSPGRQEGEAGRQGDIRHDVVRTWHMTLS